MRADKAGVGTREPLSNGIKKKKHIVLILQSHFRIHSVGDDRENWWTGRDYACCYSTAIVVRVRSILIPNSATDAQGSRLLRCIVVVGTLLYIRVLMNHGGILSDNTGILSMFRTWNPCNAIGRAEWERGRAHMLFRSRL